MALPANHMQKRESEKADALANIMVALNGMQDERRQPDDWERVHLVYAFFAFFAGCYALATTEARLSLTPTGQRGPNAKLPTDSIFHHADLPWLTKLWQAARAEPAMELPHFGPVTLPLVLGTPGKSWV